MTVQREEALARLLGSPVPVGQFAGMAVMLDPKLPDNVIRFVESSGKQTDYTIPPA